RKTDSFPFQFSYQIKYSRYQNTRSVLKIIIRDINAKDNREFQPALHGEESA
ncbi:MAG: hypothetical protein ACJAY1_000121, partial [Glaciecola sp.]